MRIRVGVRFRLSTAGCSGRDGNEGWKDTDAFRSPCWWIRQNDISSLQARGTNRRISAAAAADEAAQSTTENMSAADESLLTTVSAAGRKTPASQQTSTGTGKRLLQGAQHVWQNVADFWFFADARNVPTMGNLKQRLLQSLLQGVVAVPPGIAAVLASVARDFQCYQQQSHPLCCDSLWHSVQFPLRGVTAPQVVLQLHGALLPDDQPLHLLERDDNVELCISSSSMPPVTADSTAALYAPPGASECLRSSCLFSHPAPSHIKGSLFQKSGVAGSCDRSICGCCGARCNSTHSNQRRVISCRQRRTRKKSAALPLQHHISKRRRVHEMPQPESSSASLPCLDQQGGDAAEQLPPASMASSSASSREKKASTTVAQTIVKQTAHPSCKSAIRIGAPTGVGTIHGRSRHSSSHSSTTSSSSSRRSSTSSRSSSENGEEWDRNSRRRRIQKKGLDAARERGVAVVSTLSKAANTAQEVGEHPVVSEAFSAKKIAVAAGDAPVGAERRRKCAVDKRVSGRKGALNGTTAITRSAQRSESAVLGRTVTAIASVRSIPSDVQRPPTVASATTARRHYGVVSVRETTSEEESNSDEDGSEETLTVEEKGNRVSSSGVAVGAIKTPRIVTTKQNRQQSHLASKETLAAKTCTGDSSSEDSSSSASSSEDSTSSGSEENRNSTSGGISKGVRNIRGRMPAAVAQATAAAISRPAISTQRNEKKTNFNQEWRMKESPAVSGLGCQRQLQSDRAAHRVEPANDSSQMQTSATCSAPYGGARNAATRAGRVEKEAFLRDQGRHAKDKWSARQQQEEKPRQRQQQQQERHRQPFQPQYEQGQNRGPSWQKLVFKPWANPSLIAVQPGQWLRVRLLHLMRGMPTLDEWKTVFVEATDVHAGRIKLWEVRQRGLLKRQGKGPDENSSNDCCSRIEEGQPSEEECVVRVPCGKQRGGPGRWLDWSELAYVSTAATAEENHAERSASVAPAAGSITDVSTEGMPAAATASSDGGVKTGHMKKECSTDLARTDALGVVTAKTAGSEGAGVPAAETSQWSAAPVRYLPRRLLSLRHQVSSNSEHTAAGEGAAATNEPAASQNSSTESHDEAIGSPHRSSHQPGSVPHSGTNVSQNDRSVTVLSTETTGEWAMAVNEVARDSMDLASCDSLRQQKLHEDPEDGSGDPTFVALPSIAAKEKKCEMSSSFSKIDKSDNGAARTRDASSKMAVDAGDSSAAASKTGVEQPSADDGGKASETRAEASAADPEKAQWEALIDNKLEIFLNDDGEAVLASHPAAPTASFHLPLPRELVVECSRRLKAARHNRRNTRNHRAHSEASSVSASSGGDRNATILEPSSQINGAETDGMQPQVLCTEEESFQQQLPGKGSAQINVDLGEETAEKMSNVSADGVSSSTGRTKRIIAAEDWKGFEYVKACARRVVGEQLQHIRRALRRQVDYYFSPANWQRDFYLRSRAVPLSSTCYNNSFAGRGSDSFTSCAAEEAPAGVQGHMGTSPLTTDKDNRQVTVSSPIAGGPRFSSAEAQERATVGREADRENLAVNLDDIMVFPRMRGLSRDKDFVAWCIKAGGGLHHVRVESRGETYWLVRNKRAETK